MNIKETEDAFTLDVYPKRDVVFVKGKGCKLYDEEGKEYIDCASNVGVSAIGHGNEFVAQAIYEQYLRLANCYGIFYNNVRARLAEKLAHIAPGHLKKVFFCNSGTEAVEAAIKFARTSKGKKGNHMRHAGFSWKDHGLPRRNLGAGIQKTIHAHA